MSQRTGGDVADSQGRVLVEPISVGRFVLRFALAGFVALVFVAIFTAYASRRVGTEQAIDEAKRVAFVSSAGIVQPLLDDDAVAMDRDALDRVDAAVRRLRAPGPARAGQDLDRGRHDRLLRRAAPDRPAVRPRRGRAEVARERRAEAEVSDLSSRRTVRDRARSCSRSTCRTDAERARRCCSRRTSATAVSPTRRAAVAQLRPDRARRADHARAVQIPLAWSLARRLRAQPAGARALLQPRARRLRGRAPPDRQRPARRRRPGPHRRGADACRRGRAAETDAAVDATALGRVGRRSASSIKSLRSLLVDIYPPNLREEGLAVGARRPRRAG